MVLDGDPNVFNGFSVLHSLLRFFVISHSPAFGLTYQVGIILAEKAYRACIKFYLLRQTVSPVRHVRHLIHLLVSVHIDADTAMTGASKFGERYGPVSFDFDPEVTHSWNYSKDETHTDPKDYIQYTHLLTAHPEKHTQYFRIVEIVLGYDKLQRVAWKDWFRNSVLESKFVDFILFRLELAPKIYIMERKNE
jgi:hypothetical protein